MLNSSAMISRDGATIDDANGSRNDRSPMQDVALSFEAFGQHRGSFVVSTISGSTLLDVFSGSSLQLPLPLPMPLSLSCDFVLSDIFFGSPRIGTAQLMHDDASVVHYLYALGISIAYAISMSSCTTYRPAMAHNAPSDRRQLASF
jgi:hypothetical protein